MLFAHPGRRPRLARPPAAGHAHRRHRRRIPWAGDRLDGAFPGSGGLHRRNRAARAGPRRAQSLLELAAKARGTVGRQTAYRADHSRCPVVRLRPGGQHHRAVERRATRSPAGRRGRGAVAQYAIGARRGPADRHRHRRHPGRRTLPQQRPAYLRGRGLHQPGSRGLDCAAAPGIVAKRQRTGAHRRLRHGGARYRGGGLPLVLDRPVRLQYTNAGPAPGRSGIHRPGQHGSRPGRSPLHHAGAASGQATPRTRRQRRRRPAGAASLARKRAPHRSNPVLRRGVTVRAFAKAAQASAAAPN